MANTTSNYNLKKPLGSEEIDVTILNDNFDVIDEALTPLVSQETVPSLEFQKGTISSVVSWLANRIKAITGCTSWMDNPATTLAKCSEHIISGIHRNVTTSKSGFMGPADKRNLEKANTKLAAYEVVSLNFTVALGADALATIEDITLCTVADIMFCRHIQPGMSLCGRAKIQFFPGGESDEKVGSISVIDVVGTSKYKDQSCGFFGIVKHNDGTYYITFDNNFSSTDDVLDYRIVGLNIKPITPKHISSLSYKYMVSGDIIFKEG